MTDIKTLISLKWEPKLPGLSLEQPKTKSSSRHEMGLLETLKSDLVDIPAPRMTPNLKMDLQYLKLRPVIDRARHYKKSASRSIGDKYCQIGTVIEPAEEFYSSRVTKKNRKTSLAEELVSDPKIVQYRKRKVREIEEKNREVQNKKWKRKGKDSKNTRQRRN